MAQFTPKICTELLEYTAVGIGDFETVIGYRLLYTFAESILNASAA